MRPDAGAVRNSAISCAWPVHGDAIPGDPPKPAAEVEELCAAYRCDRVVTTGQRGASA